LNQSSDIVATPIIYAGHQKSATSIAALPQHTAVRLCLTGAITENNLRLRLHPEAQPQYDQKNTDRKAEGFPQCAAAEPPVSYSRLPSTSHSERAITDPQLKTRAREC